MQISSLNSLLFFINMLKHTSPLIKYILIHIMKYKRSLQISCIKKRENLHQANDSSMLNLKSVIKGLLNDMKMKTDLLGFLKRALNVNVFCFISYPLAKRNVSESDAEFLGQFS